MLKMVVFLAQIPIKCYNLIINSGDNDKMTIALNVKGSNLNEVYSFKISGIRYYLHVYYNERAKGWQVVSYDTNNNPITTPNAVPLLDLGKMMPNAALTWRYVTQNTPFQGEIVCVDTIGTGTDPVGKDNFGDGKQYQLVYFTENEIEEFRIAEWTTYKVI